MIIPRDPQSGQPTGQRAHKPVVTTKVYDKSSPLLQAALTSAKKGDGFTFKKEINPSLFAKNISSNEVISVQFPKENGAAACCKLTKTTGEEQQQGDATDLLNESEIHIYGLGIQYKAPFVGIVIIGKNATANGVSAIEIKDHATTITTCFS